MQYPKEIKSQTIARYKSKESVISISNETGIPRSTIYRWLNESKNSNHPNIKDKEIKELERKVEKLQTMLDIIRELGISINAPLKEKLNANSVVESFFSNLKREELYRTKYRSDKEFKKAVDEYMAFYNSQRPHSNNNYRTPDAKEAEYYSKNST